MALTHSNMVPLQTPAPDFSLPGTDGTLYALSRFADRPVLVVVFMCNHCPYVQAVLPRLTALARHFEAAGVQFAGINPNDPEKYPDDSLENMQKLVAQHRLPFPYLIDETQETARRYAAVCTPDFFVFGPERKLTYRGRLDDNWQHPDQVTGQDLKDAIESTLAGRAFPRDQIPSMGCSIKWK
ncbi:MAG: thioredoxin family protein [Nitrospinaceae bacterium]